jgi:hypothetical protein
MLDLRVNHYLVTQKMGGTSRLGRLYPIETLTSDHGENAPFSRLERTTENTSL